MDVVQLWEFFLVKHIYIYIFWLAEIIISNLTMNTLQIFKLENFFKINPFSFPQIDFLTKIYIYNYFPTNNLLVQITFPYFL